MSSRDERTLRCPDGSTIYPWGTMEPGEKVRVQRRPDLGIGVFKGRHSDGMASVELDNVVWPIPWTGLVPAE